MAQPPHRGFTMMLIQIARFDSPDLNRAIRDSNPAIRDIYGPRGPKPHPDKPLSCNMPLARTEVAMQFSESCSAEVALQHSLFCSADVTPAKSCAATNGQFQPIFRKGM